MFGMDDSFKRSGREEEMKEERKKERNRKQPGWIHGLPIPIFGGEKEL